MSVSLRNKNININIYYLLFVSYYTLYINSIDMYVSIFEYKVSYKEGDFQLFKIINVNPKSRL